MFIEKSIFNIKNNILILIEGDDKFKFIQGIISNDIQILKKKKSIYASILTPQGRFLYDFFITNWENNFLLEKQVKSPFKSKKWMVLRKTGVESKFVNTIQQKLRDVMCITEPLMLRLQDLWDVKAESFDDLLSNVDFYKSMPLPANLFRDHIYQTAGKARESLIKYWIPKAIVMIIKSACTYVEVVEKEKKREKNRFGYLVSATEV